MEKARRTVESWPDWMQSVSPVIRPPQNITPDAGPQMSRHSKNCAGPVHWIDLPPDVEEGEDCPGQDGGRLFLSAGLSGEYQLRCGMYPGRHNRPANADETEFAKKRAALVSGACC